MATNPQIVRTVTSSTFSNYVAEVDVYDTTLVKIAEFHPLEYEQIETVFRTIETDATRLHQSKSNPYALVFINDNVRSPDTGDPLRVIAKVYDDGRGILTTAHYTSSNDQGPLLWSATGGIIVPRFVGKNRGT